MVPVYGALLYIYIIYELHFLCQIRSLLQPLWLLLDWISIKKNEAHIDKEVSLKSLCCTLFHPGMVYGSLHFITFDGSEYSFKGLGEYVIVRLSSSTGSNIFTLQGQTEVLVVNGQTELVPALVRLAAFYQGAGKVSLIFQITYWSMCINCVCPQCIDCKIISRKVEWRCAESGDGLKVLVNDEVIPVSVGKKHVQVFSC